MSHQRTEESRLVKNLLAAAANNRDKDSGPVVHPFNTADHNRSIPRRPASSNPTKRRSRSGDSRQRSKQQEVENAIIPDRSSRQSKEDLVIEILELKKKNLVNEDTIAFLKSENHRLETEASKQQRRIEQLLNLSEGVKTSSVTQSVRRDIEKSILVRQLKQQLAHLRNLVADKDVELDNAKKDIRFTRVKEVEFERDEYYSEIQRLRKTVEDVKDELQRERQRREWNSKLAGETGDDLRKELAKLASGYQSILANISHAPRQQAQQRPSTSAGRAPAEYSSHRKPEGHGSGRDSQRPRSAGSAASNSKAPASAIPMNEQLLVDTYPLDDRETVNNVDILNVDEMHNQQYVVDSETHDNNVAPLERASLDAGFNTEDYETTDGDSSRGTGVEPKTTFQPLGSFLPMQQAVYAQTPQFIAALPTVPQYQFTPKFNAGDRVKAKFRGGETYYNGRVSVVQADGLYRIVYDDNDEEGNVPESRIIPFDGENAPSSGVSVTSSHLGQNLFKVGDKVEALYYNGTKWYKGEIKSLAYTEAKSSFTYEVAYEDGEREKHVLEANVRLLNPQKPQPSVDLASIPDELPAVQLHNQVSAESIPTIDESTIASAQANPTSVVVVPGPPMETKDVVKVTTPRMVSPRVGTEASSQSITANTSTPVAVASNLTSHALPQFNKGDLVEANYGQAGTWYPGRIASVQTNGDNNNNNNNSNITYNIAYDDGDEEKNVSEACIRARSSPPPVQKTDATPAAKTMPTATSAIVSSTASLQGTFHVGDKIEGYFEEYAAWFSGSVKAVNVDGSYYVVYDDGDEETSVLGIRLRKKAVSIRKERYSVGERVEARFHGDAAWFPGKIVKVNYVGGKTSYNIVYDDGDSEDEVVSELIRVLDPTLSQAPSAADLAVAAAIGVSSAAQVAAVVLPSSVKSSPIRGESDLDGSPNSKQNHRHGSQHTITSTNLDNFLNELSDDDDGPLPPIGVVESSGENEYNNDDFEA